MSLARRYTSSLRINSVSTYLIVPILIGVSLLSGCEPEPQDTSSIIGKWNVYDATRNGRRTTTLEDAYFNFVNDTLLLTNILREEQAFSYVYADDKIRVDGPLKTTYIVSQPSGDTINLYGAIKGYDFGFFTVRDTISDIPDLNDESAK